MKCLFKSVLLLILFLYADIISAQMLGFMSMHEGYEKAKSKAIELGFENPELAGVWTSTISFEIMAGMPEIKGKIALDGENIGKATFWSYIFKETNKSTEIIVAKVVPMQGTLIAAEINDPHFHQYHDIDIFLDTTKHLEFEKIITSETFVNAATKQEEYDADGTDIYKKIFLGLNIDTTGNLIYFTDKPITWYMAVEDVGGTDNWPYTYCWSYYDRTSDIFCTPDVGIADSPVSIDVSIYPNPSSHTLIINNSSKLIFTEIAVYNTKGELQFICENNIEFINISSLAAGNYFVGFTYDKIKTFKRFVVE